MNTGSVITAVFIMNWQYATPEEYLPICELFQSSKLGNSFVDIRRRISIPLFLRQLITFYEGSKLCGFITFAFLSDEAESHMPNEGIHPADWRSGKNFWVIDFGVKRGFDGFAMLRAVTKGLGVKRARYFRKKHKEIREVRVWA